MRTTVKCPTCRQETSWQGNPYRPFCSSRCRTIDLGAWATESYRVPGEKIAPEESNEGEAVESKQRSTKT